MFGMGVVPFVVAANSSMLLGTTESAPQLQCEKQHFLPARFIRDAIFS